MPFLTLLFLLSWTTPAQPAVIVGYEIRGGGCLNPSCDVGFDISGLSITLNKRFLRNESTEEGDTGGVDGNGHTGNKGGMDGQIGPPSGGGHEEDPNHVELYSRLPPINVFLTLRNSASGVDVFEFSESVFNGTVTDWLGFMMALRRNETGLARFLPGATATPFDVVKVKGEHGGGTPVVVQSTFSDPTLSLPPDASANFAYRISFGNCTSGVNCSDRLAGGPSGFDGYVVNLQEFPLVAPVPEPGTAIIVGTALIVAAYVRRRSRLAA